MNRLGEHILDDVRKFNFRIHCYHGLFEAIGLFDVQRWLNIHGPQWAKYISRHLDTPSVRDGIVRIPPVTDWVMTTYGGDNDVMSEYCMGRHSGVMRSGNARDRRKKLEASLALFRPIDKNWIKLWTEYELSANDLEAKWDDEMDDQLNRM